MGIGRWLKIRGEVVACVAPLEPFDSIVDLVQNRDLRHASAGAEATIIAERAPPGCHSPIDVGAGKTGVDTDFLDAVAKFVLEKKTVGVISTLRVPPIIV